MERLARRQRASPWRREAGQAHLQLLRPLLAQRLQREAEVAVIGQRAQVEVVLGVDAGGDVDVELKQLQEVALHLVPAEQQEGWLSWSVRSVHQEPWRTGTHMSSTVMSFRIWQ